MTALLMFGGFALLLIFGVPIALSLGVSTMAAIAGSPDITVSINTVAQRIFGGLDSTSIMAIAFFVLSGNLMTRGGISRRICEFARSIIGGVRGGMALTLVLACAFFAALSGSAAARRRRTSLAPNELDGGAEAADLNREALFSAHAMTDAQRDAMKKYVRTVLDACRHRWSFGQKLVYRWIECLYL